MAGGRGRGGGADAHSDRRSGLRSRGNGGAGLHRLGAGAGDSQSSLTPQPEHTAFTYNTRKKAQEHFSCAHKPIRRESGLAVAALLQRGPAIVLLLIIGSGGAAQRGPVVFRV